MLLEAKVLTVSDSVASGHRIDGSGPAVTELLERSGFTVLANEIVSDDPDRIESALVSMATGFEGLLVSTGGTGFATRDHTPEATGRVLDREAPGFVERMRQSDPLGPLSRGRSGTRGSCLIVNLPGSPTAATDCLTVLLPLFPHALELLAGHSPH